MTLDSLTILKKSPFTYLNIIKVGKLTMLWLSLGLSNYTLSTVLSYVVLNGRMICDLCIRKDAKETSLQLFSIAVKSGLLL
jgi:hypothetical protein